MTWIWIVFITVLSLLPGSMTPGMGIPFADKLGHFGFYSIFSLLALHGYRDKIPVVLILTGIIAYSICIEGLQRWLSVGRHFEFLDILANIIGSFAGYFVFLILNHKKRS